MSAEAESARPLAEAEGPAASGDRQRAAGGSGAGGSGAGGSGADGAMAPSSDTTPGWAPPDGRAKDVAVPAGPHFTATDAGTSALTAPATDGMPAGPMRTRRTNTWAKAALGLGLVGLVVFAIGFAVIALVQTGRRGEKGRNQAITALAACAVWTVALTAVGIKVDMDGSGTVMTRATGPRVTTLRAGDCVTGFQDGVAGIYATKSPCAIPHEGEIGAVTTAAGSRFPGDAKLVTETKNACEKRTGFLPGDGSGDDLKVLFDRPRREAWEGGDHGLACVFRRAAEQRHAPARSTGSVEIRDLRAGECVGKWRLDDDNESLVDCGSEHEAQMLGVFTVPGDEWPGMKAESAMAKKGCGMLWAMTFGAGEPRAPLRERNLRPTRNGWEDRYRRIVCLIASRDRALRGSLMPG